MDVSVATLLASSEIRIVVITRIAISPRVETPSSAAICAPIHCASPVVSMAVAGAVGVTAYALPLKLNIVVAIGAAVFACLLLESRGLAKGARA